MAARNGDHIVWQCVVLNPFDIIGQTCRQCVVRNRFETICQQRVAGNSHGGFQTQHGFHGGAQLNPLDARITRQKLRAAVDAEGQRIFPHQIVQSQRDCVPVARRLGKLIINRR